MIEQDRVVRVSAGAVELVTGKVTERDGKDISGAVFAVGLGGRETPPAAWFVPFDTSPSEGGSVVTVTMLVSAENAATIAAGGTSLKHAHLWVRIIDAPETLIRRCEGGSVTVE